jgi:hypothetical protein
MWCHLRRSAVTALAIMAAALVIVRPFSAPPVNAQAPSTDTQRWQALNAQVDAAEKTGDYATGRRP